MLRSTILGMGVLACSAAGALAQGQPTAFAGGFVVTGAVGAACADISVQVGENFQLVFRPTIGGSGPAVIQLLTARRGNRFENSLNRNFAATGSYTGTVFTGRGGLIEDHPGTYSNFVVTPRAPTATTDFVTITGTLSNFSNVNCEVTFRAAGARVP